MEDFCYAYLRGLLDKATLTTIKVLKVKLPLYKNACASFAEMHVYEGGIFLHRVEV
jgi:hypothetical protein